MKPWRKLRPPTGPISPAAKEARRGRSAELVGDREHIVVRRPEHRPAPTIAGEDDRSRRRLAGEGLDPETESAAKVLIGRLGIPRMEADDLALADRGPDDQTARLRIRPEHAAHEEVALLILRPAALDHESDQEPAGQEHPLPMRQLADDLLDGVERGPPGELVDDVALGRGDRELSTDRGGPLGDAGEHLDAA